MAVKYRIVMSSEIARCPPHRLDPQHWIPRHKTEQCRPRQRKPKGKRR